MTPMQNGNDARGMAIVSFLVQACSKFCKSLDNLECLRIFASQRKSQKVTESYIKSNKSQKVI